MVGLMEVGVEIVTPVMGATFQLWVPPAVPVWVKVIGTPVQPVLLTGVNAAETEGTTVTETVLVTVLQGVLTTHV